MVICLETGAHCHLAFGSSWCHIIISCITKIQYGFTFLVPVYTSCPGNEAIKWVLCILIESKSMNTVVKGHFKCTMKQHFKNITDIQCLLFLAEMTPNLQQTSWLLYLRLLFLRRWHGSIWFIISERNSLLFTPVSSLIDTRLFTVYTCSFTVSFNTFYISPYYVTSQHANPHRPQPPIIA